MKRYLLVSPDSVSYTADTFAKQLPPLGLLTLVCFLRTGPGKGPFIAKFLIIFISQYQHGALKSIQTFVIVFILTMSLWPEAVNKSKTTI